MHVWPFYASISAVMYRFPNRHTGVSRAYILENQVTHIRLLPAESAHSFTYPTLSFLLSLNALETGSLDLFRGWVFGYGGALGRLTGLRSNGYLIEQGQKRSIKDKLIQILQERGYDGCLLEDAWIMTMPSFLGWASINPLTVYFCYKSTGEYWITVLEVHNTFGEGHVYIMEMGHNEDEKPPVGYDHQWTIPRAFHVSPFNDRLGFYRISVKSPSHSPSGASIGVSVSPPRPAIRIHLHTSRDTTKPSEAGVNIPGSLKSIAILRPTIATSLTTRSLLSALCRMPFALLLTFPRILYQAKILHYKKRLDVFIRPEPHPVTSDPEAKNRITGGGIIWQKESLLERYARKTVEQFLKRRVDDTGITVSLVSGNPSVGRRTFSPETKHDAASNAHLVIHYLSSRFFTILFQSPSAAHAYLLGSTTDHIFTTSSKNLFLIVFSFSSLQLSRSSYFVSSLTMQQWIRIRSIPLSLRKSRLLPIPAKHSLDSASFYQQLWSIILLCGLLFLDNFEKWIFYAVHARVIPGDEPWKKWERAERALAEDSFQRREDGDGIVDPYI